METNYIQKKKILFSSAFSFVVVVTTLGWVGKVYFRPGESVFTNDAQVEAYITPISSRIPGYIKQVRFSEHEAVKKGDTLVLIDDREYRIGVEQAEAALLDALAGKTVMHAGTAIARNGVGISEANMAEVKARLENAELNLARYDRLLKEDVATQFQYDEVKTERDALQAKYTALCRVQVGSMLTAEETDRRVSVSDAAIKKAMAALELAKLNLSYTVITAPYDGVLGRRTIEEQQLVQSGQSLVSIVNCSDKWLTANFTESELPAIHPGLKVKIRIDALPGKRFEGEVMAISEASGSRYSAIPVDNSIGNFVKVQQRFPVRIRFTEPNEQKNLDLLRAGMNAEVESIR